MALSLKENYRAKRLGQATARARQVDARLLSEARAAQLLVEAMDEDDLATVTQIIQKLTTLKTPDLPKLKAAIEQAEAELNKYTAGGPLTKAWTKMKGLVGIDNPVVKVTAFADALERGFSQIPQILKNNGVDLKGADLNKSLAQALGRAPASANKPGNNKVGAKSDRQMAKSPVTGKSVPKDKSYKVPRRLSGTSEGVVNEDEGDSDVDISALKGGLSGGDGGSGPPTISVPNKPAAAGGKAADEKVKSIAAQLQKALSPGGIFGAFKKVPYIDSATLAAELVRAPLRAFSQVAKRIQQGAKAADVAPDLKDQAQGQGGAETKGTGEAQPAKPSAQTATSQPAKAPTATTDDTGTGQETPKPQGGGAPQNLAAATQKVKQAITAARAKSGGMDLEVLTKKLMAAGLDPNKL